MSLTCATTAQAKTTDKAGKNKKKKGKTKTPYGLVEVDQRAGDDDVGERDALVDKEGAGLQVVVQDA
jgi:hypothetical protein